MWMSRVTRTLPTVWGGRCGGGGHLAGCCRGCGHTRVLPSVRLSAPGRGALALAGALTPPSPRARRYDRTRVEWSACRPSPREISSPRARTRGLGCHARRIL